MNSETWLDKASQLQRLLLRPSRETAPDVLDEGESERIRIALWLRREFSSIASEPPPETGLVDLP